MEDTWSGNFLQNFSTIYQKVTRVSNYFACGVCGNTIEHITSIRWNKTFDPSFIFSGIFTNGLFCKSISFCHNMNN